MESKSNWLALNIAIQYKGDISIEAALEMANAILILRCLEGFGLKPKELSDAEIKEIIKQAKKGTDYDVVAKRFGITAPRVDTILRKDKVRVNDSYIKQVKKMQDAAKYIRRAKAYWSTFKVGHRVIVQTEVSRKGFRRVIGIITFISGNFMNVLTKSGMTSVRMHDIILKERPTKIKHIRERQTAVKADKID